MRLRKVFEAQCSCGKTHEIDWNGAAFVCSCGRKSELAIKSNEKIKSVGTEDEPSEILEPSY